MVLVATGSSRIAIACSFAAAPVIPAESDMM